MRELYTCFHPLNLEVSQSVPMDDSSFDYRGLGRWTDFLILMAYDEHSSESEPGPIASQSWYARLTAKRLKEIGSDKYVIGIGNYGYDWKKGTTKGKELSFQESVKTAKESEGQIALDPLSLNPFFQYYDDNNQLREVWFLNAVTAFNQLAEGYTLNPRGFALWRLGSEDPSLWPMLDHRDKLDKKTAETLQTMRYGYDWNMREAEKFSRYGDIARR